jgi:cytochrome o ubiquinol oxidase subunit 2
VIVTGGGVLFKELVGHSTVALFAPAGPTAGSQSRLIATLAGLMLLVAIPTFITLFTVAWKYRAGGRNENYEPERTGGFRKELLLWAIPAALIAVLAVLNWKSVHELDPYSPVRSVSGAQPLTVEVVALPWKWLFIYPKQGIASVNYLEFPERTPLQLKLTAEGPMSSFWIPQLGSQMYAMAAMMTQLNLEASATGEYLGRNTEINGKGYAGMTFPARSVTAAEFDAWVAKVKKGPNRLDTAAYTALAAPSEGNPPVFYASVDGSLFDTVMMKFMVPASTGMAGSSSMPGMEMPAGMDMDSMPGMHN